jgi:1,4-dihydroxy-6-naphthoate synthase
MGRAAMTRRLAIGISTCPNDTFAFHALLEGLVRPRGIELEFELADIESLNERLLDGRLDVAKASAHALLAAPERVIALPVGWALGRGVGPIVLGARSRSRPSGRVPLVLAPGRFTTATLLWRLFHPEPGELEQRPFSAILPALARGEADLGACIHEARFTWHDWEVDFVEDLGTRWEEHTGEELPLGGLAASRAVPADVLCEVARAARASLEWGLAHREETLPTLRRHAQEASDAALLAHVELYVSARTLDLGSVGRRALAALAEVARARGLLHSGRSSASLEVLEA